MGALLFASAFVGPLVLACGVAVLALSLFVEKTSFSILAMYVMLVASAPAVAACATATLYRWCFPSGSARSLMNAAGLLALLALLSDGYVLASVAQLSVSPSPAVVVQIVSVASVVGALSCAVVMMGVLLFEIPVRWFLPSKETLEWEGILLSARAIATVIILVIGWGLIDEFARARLSSLLVIFS